MHQFNDTKLLDEDKREIEKDYKIKLDLPDEETKWYLNEPSLISEELDAIEKSVSNHVKKLKSSNQPQSLNPQLVYEQISKSQINLPSEDLVISDHKMIT